MAKVRIEWVRLSRSDFERGAAVNDIGELLAVQTLTVSSTAVQSDPAPGFSGGDGFARLSAVSGAVNVASGAAPVASETSALRVEPGAPVIIGAAGAQVLSLIEAADPPATLNVASSAISAEAVSHSATIAAAAVAQDLMAANPARKGWEVQNQSGGDLYVRSKGSAGTMVATTDQNSLKIPAGALYTADAHVTPNALSIIGASAGQAFYAREW